MSKINDLFSELRAKNQRALVLFFTAGDQPIDDLPEIIETLAAGGADLIEVGIPFSDPFGEGPTIQASSQRALDNGATPVTILEAISRVHIHIPIVTMGYYNTYLRFGLDEIAKRSREAGVSGAIISDLVPDEGEAWSRAAEQNGLDTIYLVAPTSTDMRIAEACQRTTGFVYAVSRTGVTGAESEVPVEVSSLVSRIKEITDRPVCVGFGISKPDHVRTVCKVADGAVVGSSLVDLLHREWPQGKQRIIEAIAELKAATT